MYGRINIKVSTKYSWNSIQNLFIKNVRIKNATSKKIIGILSKNIFLVNILLKSTNRNILGHSLQGKHQPY